MSEKGQSLPLVGGNGHPVLLARAQTSPGRSWILKALIWINVLVFAYNYFIPSHLSWPRGRPDAVRVEGQCAQVAPLKAALVGEKERLEKMDKFLESEAFRNESIARVAGAVQIPSQSYDNMGPIDEDPRWKPMGDVADYLERTFPLIHKGTTVTLKKVNTYGLLYTWHGSDSYLKPTVLMAHQDVVPVEQSTVGQWDHPPFSGDYDGKFIWGRGASDCKNSLVGILEAVELLIAAGYKPKRTVIMAFGFDEEISGGQGASHLSQAILQQYGKNGIATIIDEGAGIVSQWGRDFALPGVAEKGYMDVEVTVRMPGGHSSVPPDHTGIGILSELIGLVEANPYEPRLHSENPFLGFLQCGAAHADDFPKKLKKLLPKHAAALAHHPHDHKDKEDKLAKEAAKAGPLVKYLFTTSVAVDVISGGVKVNALPEQSRVLINHRINVGSSSSDVKDKITKLAKRVAKKHNLSLHAFEDDKDGEAELNSITLRVTRKPLEPAPVTPTSVDSTTPYSILAGTTRALYGEDMIVAPGIMTGNTDTRYYWDLSKHIFRFAPGWDPDYNMWDGIHTVNEKLSVLAHIRTVQWYSQFIRNMDDAQLD
ncbi:hypothetical protein jhhlp_000386 [Lomentospora prolificans]|uniref:Peptidase M20 dimerisation domain-containing protein n=1 Tax=Lomentospora prolificans TaxID=41688 RepID=A0A2N3NKR9_9PEZI|nr:hypothetical protein jhhlp_000386 [Lomentospora prolificans]